MKKTSILALAMGPLLLGSAHLASATTINFNNGSGVYSAGGITVTVASTGTGAGLYYNSTENAIGVGSNSTNGGIGCRDNGCADIFTGSGFVSTEALTFTFSEAVQLNSVTFRQWENNVLGIGDLAKFTWYDNTGTNVAGEILFQDSGIGDGLSQLLDTFGVDGLLLSKFTITAIKGSKTVGNSTVKAWSSFYVHSLDYDLAPAVPVPAAAWMMGSGLVGLAGLARRRKQRA